MEKILYFKTINESLEYAKLKGYDHDLNNSKHNINLSSRVNGEVEVSVNRDKDYRGHRTTIWN